MIRSMPADGVLYRTVDGFDYNVATRRRKVIVVIKYGESKMASPPSARAARSPWTAYTRRAGESGADRYGQLVYVTVSAARSPQEEADGTLVNPCRPLIDGEGDTYLAQHDGIRDRQSARSRSDSAPIPADRRHDHGQRIVTDVPNRAVVLTFDQDNWDDMKQKVFVFAQGRSALRGRPRRRRPSTASSDVSDVVGFPRRLCRSIRRGRRPQCRGLGPRQRYAGHLRRPRYVRPGPAFEDMTHADRCRIEGRCRRSGRLQLTDEVLVRLANATRGGDVVVVRLALDEDSDEADPPLRRR